MERLAPLRHWNKETGATRQGSLLQGKALDVYNGLADGEAFDYDLLERALLARYRLTSETYRRKLGAAKRKEREAIVLFVAVLETFFSRRLALSGEEWSFEVFVDLLLQEQLIVCCG